MFVDISITVLCQNCKILKVLIRSTLTVYTIPGYHATYHTMEKDKAKQSWVGKLLRRIFSCQQKKKKKKELRRFSSFKSVEITNTGEERRVGGGTRIVMNSGVHLIPAYQQILSQDIIRSR